MASAKNSARRVEDRQTGNQINRQAFRITWRWRQAGRQAGRHTDRYTKGRQSDRLTGQTCRLEKCKHLKKNMRQKINQTDN
jgi:hypothetical protein